MDLPRRPSITRRSSGSFSQLYRPEIVDNNENAVRQEKMWSLSNSYLPTDLESIQKQVVQHVEYTLARTRFDFTKFHCYQAVSHSVRDRLIEQFNVTNLYFHEKDVKRIHYLSLEFLIGRCLQNAVVNLILESNYKDALMDLGYQMEALYEEEVDPALGNGGLGRLAACFMDSLATLNLPAWGYGIRYTYGIFKQLIKQGYQIEVPDYWLDKGNPWEIERIDVQYQVKFYGHVKKVWDHGKEKSIWEGGETIMARAFDTPIPGYGTFNTIGLRLWKSLPYNEFDFSSFNTGDYFKALEAKERAEYITSVLYPNDSTYAGKELRLKQQYLLVSASLQDIFRRFKKNKRSWTDFPQKVAVQLNDTHPALGIVECLRIFIDIEGLEEEEAWSLVTKTFAYTNHTVLPEALEKWGVDLLGNLLPRHLEIIYQINQKFLDKILSKFPGDGRLASSLSIVEESNPKKIRMANLCVIGSHSVNGVAAIHSDLVKTQLFKDFYDLNPQKFQNKTNGVTPRRWIMCANQGLSSFFTKYTGNELWVLNMDLLRPLEKKLEDDKFINEYWAIKKENKEKLAKWVKLNCNVDIKTTALFDVQVKRIHEYKRQFLNILYIIYRYLLIKDSPVESRAKFIARVTMFGGKAAPGYENAKRIIKLINSVAETVNNDSSIGDLLKVVFLPNYNVSNAQIIIPASELSQHISTAGTEASGTSNMKFAMNGCLIIGTWDGANIEINEEIGDENMFVFGARIAEIENLRKKMKESDPADYIPKPLQYVFDKIESGFFGHCEDLNKLVASVKNRNDFYLVCEDFNSYVQAQAKVDKLYADKREWTKKAILSSLRSAKFSSDRTILEYAKDIWNIRQCEVPDTQKK